MPVCALEPECAGLVHYRGGMRFDLACLWSRMRAWPCVPRDQGALGPADVQLQSANDINWRIDPARELIQQGLINSSLEKDNSKKRGALAGKPWCAMTRFYLNIHQ